jgi:large subunit ribosomal protein L5
MPRNNRSTQVNSEADTTKPKARAPRKKASAKPEAGSDADQKSTTALKRMRQVYLDQAVPQLQTTFEYKNSMAIPQIKKIVINMGLGEALTNGRAIENATQALTLISGQKPMVTRARKSIATFKLREGMPLGLMVTLRGHRMYDFYDRLVNASLPRIRDFRGVSRKSFDGRGNFALGIREHAIFPEIDYNTIDKIRPLQVIIVTSANTDREAVVLLENMGMPFTREVVTD